METRRWSAKRGAALGGVPTRRCYMIRQTLFLRITGQGGRERVRRGVHLEDPFEQPGLAAAHR